MNRLHIHEPRKKKAVSPACQVHKVGFVGICQETAIDDTKSHMDIIITICIYILFFTKCCQNLRPVTTTDYQIWS